ncbi:MAG: formylglycine-generating enzyme family protein [Myxococcaceae bacterium]
MWCGLGLALSLGSAPLLDVPAGHFTMGRELTAHDDEKPPHEVTVSAFALEATLVTVADFRAFVAATKHVTGAETVGFGMVATEGLKDWEWKPVKGASWKTPFGPELATRLPVHDDWPVTMVTWKDAATYCAWKGLRLPTEAEWEYAMRAGVKTRFPWGDSPTLADGGVGLNYWQGAHQKNELKDGWLYLSPVKAFAPNGWGFFDPVGNVWQYTADWYAPDTYARDAQGVKDPHGPPTGEQKVTRGGSWWCSKRTCTGYGLFARGKTKLDEAANNVGFRCAR